ncbi:hypothetical protein HDV06_005416 [Boothiomyces sp. JEL0866]|nr:hypothetical protein HDV06_005416 [Boothiomyces sp. JEL0866]
MEIVISQFLDYISEKELVESRKRVKKDNLVLREFLCTSKLAIDIESCPFVIQFSKKSQSSIYLGDLEFITDFDIVRDVSLEMPLRITFENNNLYLFEYDNGRFDDESMELVNYGYIDFKDNPLLNVFEEMMHHQKSFAIDADITITQYKLKITLAIRIDLSETVYKDRLAIFSKILPTFLCWEDAATNPLLNTIIGKLPYHTPLELLQPQKLVAELLKFQRLSLEWMLSREGVQIIDQQSRVKSAAKSPNLISEQLFADGLKYINWKNFTISDEIDNSSLNCIQGGLLCDEMGLGKTLMVLALILLNPLQDSFAFEYFNPKLINCGATLIITPISILAQWRLEIETNAPHLKVFLFEGQDIKAATLATYDIVLCTYTHLQRELYAALPGREKSTRRETVYEKRTSPFVLINWWRVVLDEAQLVQGKNKTLEMALMIPRVHPWAVTGTPAARRGNLMDILQSLNFIQANELYDNLDSLSYVPQDILKNILSSVVRRNMKKDVEDELVIPNQHNNIIKLSYTPIEFQYYSDLVDEALADIGPEPPCLLGEPSKSELVRYESKISKRLERMRHWLLRLRQTCCHPQVSAENRKALGGRLQNIGEVLEILIERSYSTIIRFQRLKILNYVEQAQILEQQKNYDEPIEILKEKVEYIDDKLQEFKRQYVNFEKFEKDKKVDEVTYNEDEEDSPNLLVKITNRMRIWKAMKHKVFFYIASIYNVKSRDDENDAESKENETLYYEYASKIREDLLSELVDDVVKGSRNLDTIFKKHSNFMKNNEMEILDLSGGFSTERIFSAFEKVENVMEKQWKNIVEWRNRLRSLLTSPLEASSDEKDTDKDGPTGTEYEYSIMVQDTATKYLDSFISILQDRRFTLTGVKQAFPLGGADSELEKKLLNERKGLVNYNGDNYKSLIQKLNSVLRKTHLPNAELELAKMALSHTTKQFERQIKILASLEQEISLFRHLFNCRVKYYAQLNKLSDDVTVTQFFDPLPIEMQNLKNEEADLQRKIVMEEGRMRYLIALSRDTDKADEETQCATCQSNFASGVLTPCGHFACQDCTKAWLIPKRKCALCTQHFHPTELQRVSFNRKRIVNSVPTYSDQLLEKIQNIPIKGSNGVKFDSILKHILMIKEESPMVKIICFSQWKEVLEIFANALQQNGIGHISLEGKGWDPVQGKKSNFMKRKGNSVIEFQTNPNVTVFMLNAKSQSSGLTLVSATHIFLIEPVLQKGVIQQAINRVHRIGQEKETFVWQYVIQDTVEETVSQLQTDEDGKEEHIRKEVLPQFFQRESY